MANPTLRVICSPLAITKRTSLLCASRLKAASESAPKCRPIELGGCRYRAFVPPRPTAGAATTTGGASLDALSSSSRTAFFVTSGRSLDSSSTALAPDSIAYPMPRCAATFWPSWRGSTNTSAPSSEANAAASALPATTNRRSPAAAARIARVALRRASARRRAGSSAGPKRCLAESKSLTRTMTHVLIACPTARGFGGRSASRTTSGIEPGRCPVREKPGA